MAEPEKMFRLVGRLQAAKAVIESAIGDVQEDMHTLDLLAVAQDAVHRAMMRVWGAAPEWPTEHKELPRG